MKLRHHKKNVADRIRFNRKQGYSYSVPGFFLLGGSRAGNPPRLDYFRSPKFYGGENG